MKKTSKVDTDWLETEGALEEIDGFEATDAFADELEDLYLGDAEDVLDEFGDAFDPVPVQPMPPGRGITQARPPTRRRPSPGVRRTPSARRTPPRPRAPATRATLHRFTRAYVRNMVRRRRRIDCADLAIEVWIQFGEQYGIPVSFRVWDSRGRRWMTATRSGVRAGGTLIRSFASSAAFIRWVQSNLGTQGLIANTFAVPGGHRRAVAGDVFLWQYRHARTRALARVGHTQILDGVVRGPGAPSSDTITIYQGNLPPVVPQRRTRPASFFYRNRTVTIGGAPHTGIPVGPGPRRFNGFRSLP